MLIREADDKITAKTFDELITKLENHGYSCYHYYDEEPYNNWLYITKDDEPYEAEFYKYTDGEYELYLHNIHPTKEKEYESVKLRIREEYDRYETPYHRYTVKITPYKNMYRFDYVDNLFDKTDYCFFTYENGYEDTSYKGISEKLFYKLFDENMEPGKVYQLTTSNVLGGNVISYKEVPAHWFYA